MHRDLRLVRVCSAEAVWDDTLVRAVMSVCDVLDEQRTDKLHGGSGGTRFTLCWFCVGDCTIRTVATQYLLGMKQELLEANHRARRLAQGKT